MKPVFVVDPSKCIACMACVAACSIENGVPFPIARSDPIGWPHTLGLRTWVLWIEKEESLVSRIFMPFLCLHCQDTPCEKVCPTGATFKTSEGVVLIDKDKCIGCGYCIVACPYGARYKIKEGSYEKALKISRLDEAESRLKGAGMGINILRPPVANKWAAAERAVDKCTLCYHRKESGSWIPACVEVCPTKARAFGDLDNPEDPVARLVTSGKAKQLRPDLGTNGLVYYVMK
ncbi:MAG: 4Fe-4S dicluster domain-containing protein [Sulfolobales archaeon]